MKTKHWITKLVAMSAMTSAGMASADVGMRDGEDPFRNFQSTKSRAEVRAELDAFRAPAPATSDARGAGNIGARGVPGSRYSSRTREEVREELRQFRETQKPYSPNNLYFGS